MKTIVFAAMLMFAAAAHAEVTEVNKPVLCAELSVVIKTIMSPPYNEVSVWMGRDSNNGTGYSLFINAATKTWTFLQYGPDRACVLGTGKDSVPVLPDSVRPSI
jgi:hypothetical protein